MAIPDSTGYWVDGLHRMGYHACYLTVDFRICIQMPSHWASRSSLCIYMFSLFLHENICCGYSFEVPHLGTSNEYSQYILLTIKKNTCSGVMHKL